MMSSERGADTVVYLASSKDVAGVTGTYFSKRQEKGSSRESHDEASAKRLWEVSAALTALSAGR